MFARTTFIITLTLFFVGSVITAQLSPHDSARRGTTVATTRGQGVVTPSAAMTATPAATEEIEETIDIYGNEIIDALAKYKRDATGALYETHSPQTEVPRLASPKS